MSAAVAPGGPSGLVVASNRGPRSFRPGPDGRPEAHPSGGGLAGTLRRLLHGTDATWVAASMGEPDRQAAAAGLMDGDGIRVVALGFDDDRFRQAYDVVANGTLWFCHHHLFDLPRRPRFDRHFDEAWGAFREVNEAFARAIAETAPDGAVVLVQDYHLALVGSALKTLRPDLAAIHFTHTPFADAGILACLPDAARDDLLVGMGSFGACGFHTARWQAAFASSYPHRTTAGRQVDAPLTFASALGTDPADLEAEAAIPDVVAARAGLAELAAGRRLVVRVDRLEPSKNLLRGFWAFEELLAVHPQWRRAVTFLALCYPSRESMAEYLAYRSEVEHTVARINDTFGTPDWTPIILDSLDDRHRSVAALCAYDVLLVNSVRDGLNLVAKEGPLVNTVDGTLVLSTEAGAFDELHSAALGINPFDVSATAAAIERALAMSTDERAARAAELRRLSAGRTAADWLADNLAVARELEPARP